MTNSELLNWADSQPIALGRSWVDDLEQRKREEALFHDQYRAGHVNEQHTSKNHRFYEAARVVDNYRDAWIKRWAIVPPATFLDYACGDGFLTIQAAQLGADVAIGIDISETSVGNATENAAKAGVANRTRFLQRDCEQTGLPSNAFSACLCHGMLHHLDLSKAYPELARVMRPGGRILCVEALAYNPVIQLYRERTPDLRTDWEKKHILSMREVRLAKKWFNVDNVKFFLMAAPLATLLPAGPIRRGFLAVGHAIDAVTTRLPGLQLWSWQFAFELVKPA
jgi:ubiquinone/menaquinone biosynthesis C-methylase UbiE